MRLPTLVSSIQNTVYNSLNILICQCMVHGEADDLVGHLCCHRQILWGGTGEATIGAEGADEGIEIMAAPYALFLLLVNASYLYYLVTLNTISAISSTSPIVIRTCRGRQRMRLAISSLLGIGTYGTNLLNVFTLG